MIEDTYAEAFDGMFTRFVVTGYKVFLEEAVRDLTAMPMSVVGRVEAGIERWISSNKTPDGEKGAIVQVWGANTSIELFEKELSYRIRQAVLVQPSTKVFNCLEDGDGSIDMNYYVGMCGGGYEYEEHVYGREMIVVPTMVPDFYIEKNLLFRGKHRRVKKNVKIVREEEVEGRSGVMGGNLWFFVREMEKYEMYDTLIEIKERVNEAIDAVDGAVALFRGLCSAGSKVEEKKEYSHIGPTTNHLFCPSLKNKIKESKVPQHIGAIPETVINGINIESVKNAMREVLNAVKDVDAIERISAGNYGGKLGRYKIMLRTLI